MSNLTSEKIGDQINTLCEKIICLGYEAPLTPSSTEESIQKLRKDLREHLDKDSIDLPEKITILSLLYQLRTLFVQYRRLTLLEDFRDKKRLVQELGKLRITSSKRRRKV